MKLINLCKAFENTIVLKNFNMDIEPNKITCLFGKSGCGKTTLVNILLSLLDYDSGEIKDTIKNTSAIFQENRLLPWISVEKNISIVSNNYEYYLKSVDLWESRKMYPHELSGGMKQRLNIARGLAYNYDLILMDEPFKGIDLNLKNSIIKFINKELKNRTAILITHDIDEAILLSDKIFILNGPPLNIKASIDINTKFEQRNTKQFKDNYENIILQKLKDEN